MQAVANGVAVVPPTLATIEISLFEYRVLRQRARRFFDSLRGKSVILVLVAIVLAVSTVSTVGVIHGRSMLREQIHGQLGQTVEIARQDLDSKLLTRISAIAHAAHGMTMSRADFLARSPKLVARGPALKALFHAIVVYDARGRVIADDPGNSLVGMDASERRYFRRVSTELTTVVSAPFLTSRHSHPVVSVIAPVFDSRGSFVGAIAGRIDLSDEGFLGNLQQERLGRSGYLMVASRDGTILTGPDPADVMKPLPRVASLAPALKGREGLFEGPDHKGRRSYYAVSQMSQVPWFVVAVMPVGEALGLFGQFTKNAVIVSLIVLIILAPVAWWLFDRLLQPLEALETQIQERHQGRRQEPVAIRGGEELRSVAEAFNTVYDDRINVTSILSRREAFFRSLTESAPVGIIQTDVSGYIQFANPAFCRMLGLRPGMVTGRLWLDGIVDGDRERVDREWAAAREAERPLETVCRLDSPSRGEVWVDAVANVITNNETVLGYIAVTRDITRERQIEAQLEEERVQADAVLGILHEAVIVTSRDGQIHYINTPGLDFLGNPEPVGRGLFDLVRITCEGRPWGPEEAGDRSGVQNLDVVMTNARGEVLDLELTMLPLEQARAQRLVFVLRDDSERRRQEERLSWEATHDPLTGLANRRAFMASLVHWLGEARNGAGGSVLALVDLDHFKAVNDEGGHLLGDELLRHLAAIFRDQIRQTDIAARLGGDEFAVLLPGCGESRALEIMEQIRVRIAGQRVSDGTRDYGVTASIGLTLLSEYDESPRQTLGRADRGCYVVKDRGRDGVELIAPPDGADGQP